jgi:CheY-like chemotaxis protein
MSSTSSARILVVGHASSATLCTLQRLERERVGCVFQFENTIAEAENVLTDAQFDIVLADETVADGRGYDLTDRVVKRAGTLLVSIALSEASLWLPVVQRGTRTLGERALNSFMLGSEIVALLNEPAAVDAPPAVHGFMPESVSHRLVAGQDRRTGPQEPRGLFLNGLTEPKQHTPPCLQSTAEQPIAIPGLQSRKPGTEKALAAPGLMPSEHFR